MVIEYAGHPFNEAITVVIKFGLVISFRFFSSLQEFKSNVF